MHHCDAIPCEPDFPTVYFRDEPRFSGGKDIKRSLEDINHEPNPRKYR